MTTRSHKRKAVEELISTEIETPIPETSQNLNPVAGTSKSPRILTENLEEIKSSLRKEIMSDPTKILAENQKEMLKLIAPTFQKQTIITATEETDSESENVPENATSTPTKTKTTATTRKITPVNSRNTNNSQYELTSLFDSFSSISRVLLPNFFQKQWMGLYAKSKLIGKKVAGSAPTKHLNFVLKVLVKMEQPTLSILNMIPNW